MSVVVQDRAPETEAEAPAAVPRVEPRRGLGVQGWLGLGLLAALIAGALIAPLVEGWLGPEASSGNLFNRFAPPGGANLLGTDELGRDVLLRLLQGAQVSLFVGLAGAVLTSVMGAAIGLLAGYAGGRVDAFLMRLTDLVIALPLLPLLIVLAALDWHKAGLSFMAEGQLASVWRILLIVALFGWTTVARLVRAETLSLRRRTFVTAAEALGSSPARVIARHLLPNVAGGILVAAAITAGQLILAESVLSFLGLGVQPPLTSWGQMLSNAQELVYQAPTLAVLPGLLIFVTVLACNLAADGLANKLRPQGRG